MLTHTYVYVHICNNMDHIDIIQRYIGHANGTRKTSIYYFIKYDNTAHFLIHLNRDAF